MKRFALLLLPLFALALAIACNGDDKEGGTVATIQDRGELLCGVKQTQPLFGFKEADGSVSGFDIEFCKAIAAGVLGDATKVEFVDASGRLDSLRAPRRRDDRRADPHDHDHRLA